MKPIYWAWRIGLVITCWSIGAPRPVMLVTMPLCWAWRTGLRITIDGLIAVSQFIAGKENDD